MQILKGSVDIISDGSEVAINEIGSPYLTVGGCGDTLAWQSSELVEKDPAVKAASAAPTSMWWLGDWPPKIRRIFNSS